MEQIKNMQKGKKMEDMQKIIMKFHLLKMGLLVMTMVIAIALSLVMYFYIILPSLPSGNVRVHINFFGEMIYEVILMIVIIVILFISFFILMLLELRLQVKMNGYR